ncbi:hypothetical protein [Streptomyces sp. NPDC051546]|uniref:hypothetical protein n=1 Tax=Streptomyces sp. NPDC051546 TaxID=3365655 RepID=UPI0037ABD33E
MTYARALRWTAGAAMATAALLVTAPAQAAAAAWAPTSHLGVLAPSSTLASTPSSALASTRASTRAAVPSGEPAPATDGADRAFEDLAGSPAGAGRERPGRPVGEPANPETVLAARPVPAHPRTEPVPPVPSAPSAPSVPPVDPMVGALGNEPNERAADLAAHILPLGTGFTLMGLGLGFMGMRLRRGA